MPIDTNNQSIENTIRNALRASESYERRQAAASSQTRIPPFLGEPDGSDEWEDSLDSEHTFIHTNSYYEVSTPESIFVFGRRGTGKSAALRMLRYQVRSGKCKGLYDYCWLISEPDSYSELTQLYRDYEYVGLSLDELESNSFRRIWRWVFKAAALRAVLASNDYREIANREDFTDVIDLFEEIGFLKNGKPKSKPTVRHAADVIAKSIQDSQLAGLQPGLSLRKAVNELNSGRWLQAFELLKTFLSERAESAIILIDSVEEYKLHDPVARANVSGMVQAVSRTYSKRKSGRVLAKLALPSEIHEMVDFHGRLKQGGRKVFISWRHADLVIAMAKRFARYECKKSKTCRIDRHLKKFDDYNEARKLIYSWIPETVLSEQGQPCDTLYYILKHTQKRPRQVLIILNNILKLGEGGDRFDIDQDTIRQGIHEIGYELMCDALENYDRIYPEAIDLARSTFVRTPFVFQFSELSKMGNNAKPIRARAELSEEQVVRLYIEAGIIGRAKKVWQEDSYTHVDAEFEYQLTGPVSFRSNDYVVIHPLFYEAFGSEVFSKVIVHPVITDEEEYAARNMNSIHA